ncbi:MAG: exodeoxyribonuclease VII large subunit, partial [Xanthomonadaceae bacterium]|nr:exodeoxyribonuclease VII large subunit [Xanthomonadaceae bacterium]
MFDDLHIYSISQLNQDIRLILEGNFSSIWVEGEVSNFRVPRSGHFYFTLKDAQSQVRAVMFRRQNHSLNFLPADGDHILCLGRVSLYEPRGECQIIVESLELKGLGGLMRAFEQLKEKLAAEGIFEQSFKKTIPLLPRHVAVITSASGAAIRDILQVIHRRFANLTVTVIPVTVQGGGAAAEIIRAIKQCNATLADQVDTIILARGGGSWEDLAP